MSRTRARMLTAVILLIGLLGMHGLSSHEFMPGMPTLPATAEMSAVVSAASSGSAHAMESPATETQHMLLATETLLTPSGVALRAAAGDMTHLSCVAVLLSSLLLVLALLRRRERPARTATSAPRLALPSLRALPPPDLVAGLCVSRT